MFSVVFFWPPPIQSLHWVQHQPAVCPWGGFLQVLEGWWHDHKRQLELCIGTLLILCLCQLSSLRTAACRSWEGAEKKKDTLEISQARDYWETSGVFYQNNSNHSNSVTRTCVTSFKVGESSSLVKSCWDIQNSENYYFSSSLTKRLFRDAAKSFQSLSWSEAK